MKKLVSLALVFTVTMGMLGVGSSAVALNEILPWPKVPTPSQFPIATQQVNITPTGTVRLVGTLVGSFVTSTVGQRHFTTTLSGEQEVASVTTTATGTASLTMAGDTVARLQLTFNGLSSEETGAHIHGAAAPGEDAPILIPLPLGNLTDYPVTFTPEQKQHLESGLLYINVHSERYPDGEIRGQFSSMSASTTPTVENSTSTVSVTSTPETTERLVLVINAWNVNWHVVISSSTVITRNDGKPLAPERLVINDQLTISGQVATTSFLADATNMSGPLIMAKSVRDQSWVNRTLTGKIGDVTVNNAATTTESATSSPLSISFTVEGEDGVMVMVDENTKIKLKGRTVDPGTLTPEMSAIVTVSGYYNEHDGSLYALNITLDQTPVPTSPSDSTTSTPEGTQTIEVGPLPEETPDTSDPPKPY